MTIIVLRRQSKYTGRRFSNASYLGLSMVRVWVESENGEPAGYLHFGTDEVDIVAGGGR